MAAGAGAAAAGAAAACDAGSGDAAAAAEAAGGGGAAASAISPPAAAAASPNKSPSALKPPSSAAAAASIAERGGVGARRAHAGVRWWSVGATTSHQPTSSGLGGIKGDRESDGGGECGGSARPRAPRRHQGPATVRRRGGGCESVCRLGSQTRNRWYDREGKGLPRTRTPHERHDGACARTRRLRLPLAPRAIDAGAAPVRPPRATLRRARPRRSTRRDQSPARAHAPCCRPLRSRSSCPWATACWCRASCRRPR